MTSHENVDTVRAIASFGGRHGPLPILLLTLTVVTGLVDAVSYVALGHVFVANMTGNVVFLGFALAGAPELSASAPLVALAAFLLGAAIGGRLGVLHGGHRGHLLATAVATKLVPVAAALVVAILAGRQPGDDARYALIVLLALAMGIQNATARKLGVPDLTTTVLTLTLTGLAADARWASAEGLLPGRRLLAVMSMLIGAAIGALLVLRISIAAALGLAAALLLVTGLVVSWLSRAPAPWSAPP